MLRILRLIDGVTQGKPDYNYVMVLCPVRLKVVINAEEGSGSRFNKSI